MREVCVTRYVAPLREGGSMPAIVEADDAGMYVLKFRGAAQGPKTLIAELLAGELARAIGLPVPEIVFAQLDTDLARTEPDPEIQDLIRASGGLNLALDYLPGAFTFDPVAEKVDGSLASSVVWLDALVTNVDRTARNPNLLIWHKKLWLIDHGAALYFHHSWANYEARSRDSFPMIKSHVLLPYASEIPQTDDALGSFLTPSVLAEIVERIPDDWLDAVDSPFSSANEHRGAYVQYLTDRLAAPRSFAEEAIRARSLHL